MSYEHYRILLRSQWWDTLGSESIKLHSRWEIIRRLRLPKGDGLQCHIQSFCAAQTCFRCDLVSTRSWWSVLCNTSLNSYHVTRSRLHSPHSLSSKGSNYQRGVLLISAGATEGHFEGKTPLEGHQGGLVLAWQCTGSPGTCNTDETGIPGLPMSWSPTQLCGSGPVGLPPVPWTEKNNWKLAIFRPTRKSLLPRRPGWTDNLLNFFYWLANR